MAEPPFTEGQVVRRLRDGVRYRVLRSYVPPDPGYVDVDSFELVRIDPPQPFVQAASMAKLYEAEQSVRRGYLESVGEESQQ